VKTWGDDRQYFVNIDELNEPNGHIIDLSPRRSAHAESLIKNAERLDSLLAQS
jgi:hypothetical protein